MSGAGNLFTVIDNRTAKFSIEKGREVASLCCSSQVSPFLTDGLILLNSGDEKYDFRMDFFNPDGSYGAMCGNGARCAVRFADEKGFFKNSRTKSINFTVLDAEYHAEINENTVKVSFPPPMFIQKVDLDIQNKVLEVDYVNVGSDHAVMDFSELEPVLSQKFQDFDIKFWGSFVRNHTTFQPRGANANFYQVENDVNVQLRTFERGVEAETGACGTGAISTALIASLKYQLGNKVNIIPTSGSPLWVEFLPSLEKIEEITLEGSAEVLEKREFEIF